MAGLLSGKVESNREPNDYRDEKQPKKANDQRDHIDRAAALLAVNTKD
jgi:hypothetical protein